MESYIDIPDIEQCMELPLEAEASEKLGEVRMRDIELPLVLKNKVLMDEGRWNDNYYSADAIERAYKNTQWTKETRSLFLDHIDDKASTWVGYVTNIHFENGKLIGDLEIHDPVLAAKMLSAKPKFGISPRLKGMKDLKTNTMVDFVFENFSIVLNPAVKTAYINNFEQEVKQMPVEAKLEEQEEKKEEQEEQEQTEAQEEQKQEETKAENEELAKKKKKKKEYPYPEKYPEYPEATEEENEDLVNLSEFTDFVKEFAKKHKNLKGAQLIKAAAKAWREKQKESKLQEIAKIESALDVLRPLLNQLEEQKKLAEQVAKLSEQVEELKAEVNAPDKRSVATGATAETTENLEAKVEEIRKSDADQAMMDYLKRMSGGVL